MLNPRRHPCDDSELTRFVDTGRRTRFPFYSPSPTPSGATIDGDEGQSDKTRYSLSLASALLLRLASPIDGHRVGGTLGSVWRRRAENTTQRFKRQLGYEMRSLGESRVRFASRVRVLMTRRLGALEVNGAPVCRRLSDSAGACYTWHLPPSGGTPSASDLALRASSPATVRHALCTLGAISH